MTDEWALPNVAIEIVDEESIEKKPGAFLHLRRLKLQLRREGAEASAVFPYDMIERRLTDAVVCVLWARRGDDVVVCLRSSLRPPLYFRPGLPLPLPADGQASIWELPAGLIEPDEVGEAGLRRCAARETAEETGLDTSSEQFAFLGEKVYVTPGVFAEAIHFLEAEVDPERRGVPVGDGSPVEDDAELRFVPLDEAIDAIDRGILVDMKTEVALRRLRARLDRERAAKRADEQGAAR